MSLAFPRRRRPGDRGDHGGVAVEHRLRDQLLHVGGGGRSLQPSRGCGGDVRPTSARPRERARAGRGLARRDGRLRRAGTMLAVQRVAHRQRCSRSPTSWSTRSPVRCSASTCWRCSARARAAAPCSSPASPARSRLLRRLPQLHRVHVAVDVRPGGDAGRRRCAVGGHGRGGRRCARAR